MAQAPGLSASFFTLVFFTAVGFMMHRPLDKQGRKAVIQYLALGLVPVLARSVPGNAGFLTIASAPGWWPVTLWVLAAVFIAADVVNQPESLRWQATVKTGVCMMLILFCMGVSYIAAASAAVVTGFHFPWSAASLFLAALIRNTTEMTQEEFPDEQCETMRRVSLSVMAVTLILPA